MSDPCILDLTDFLFLPQTPIMSKRKTLTREEMEIHEVLSPASGRQGGSVQSQRTPPKTSATVSDPFSGRFIFPY